MTVREIVAAHLRSIGADGLCGEDCGCDIKNLFPCDGGQECVPALRVTKDKCRVDAKDWPYFCNGPSDCGGGCYQPMETKEEKSNG